LPLAKEGLAGLTVEYQCRVKALEVCMSRPNFNQTERKLLPEEKELLLRVLLAVLIIAAAIVAEKMGYPVKLGKWLVLAVSEWR